MKSKLYATRVIGGGLLPSTGRLDVFEKSIVEINLIGYTVTKDVFNKDFAYARRILEDLYDKVLRADPVWHYFFEGAITCLRVHKSSVKAVKARLTHYGVKYKEAGTWMHDNQAGTRKYQKVFTYLFHGFSVLAMEHKSEDAGIVIDRILHCALNPFIYRGYNGAPENPTWEAELLASNAVHRAFYQGTIQEKKEK